MRTFVVQIRTFVVRTTRVYVASGRAGRAARAARKSAYKPRGIYAPECGIWIWMAYLLWDMDKAGGHLRPTTALRDPPRSQVTPE